LLIEQIVKLLLSDIDRYFIWTATSKEDIFKFPTRKRTGSTEVNELSTSLHEVFDGIGSSRIKRENLLKAQSLILESKEDLQKELQEFLAIKGRLLSKAEKLSKIIKTKVLSIFSPKKTLDLLFWIHEVRFIGK
jgi:hypothetical protein